MLDDPRFLHSVGVTLKYAVIAVPGDPRRVLLLALVLNQGIRFLPFYRAAFYLPSLVGASVAVSLLWRQMFSGDGVFNAALALFGIPGRTWIGDPSTALYTLILLSVWTFGAPMIIFLAGLRQVPRDLYEAAEVDGAGPVRRFFSVTLPMLSPLIFFNVLLTTVNALQAFTPAYVVSNGTGGPADSTLVLHPLPLPARLHPARHGLRGGDGVGPRRRPRRLHRASCSQPPGSGSTTETNDEHICPSGPDAGSRALPDLPPAPVPQPARAGGGSPHPAHPRPLPGALPAAVDGQRVVPSGRTRRSARSASGRAASPSTTTGSAGTTARCSSPGTS